VQFALQMIALGVLHLPKCSYRILACSFTFLLPMFAVAAWAQSASPVIRYANLLGGAGSDKPSAVATDAAGNLYIAGQTASADFPNAKRLSSSGTSANGAVFVAKVDPSGGKLLYSTIVGGGQPAAIVVDSAGNAYVAGVEPSDGFPTTAGAISTTGRCFLFKLNPAGSDLVYSTRLTCVSGGDIPPAGLAVDAAGAAYLTGHAGSVTTTPGAFRTTGFGPFAMKVNAQGSALLYSTYLPQADSYASARPQAIAVDVQGNAHITGAADARGFPVTVQPLPSETDERSTDDVFLMKLSADGSKVLFSTLFGGYGADQGSAIGVDAEGFIYVAGMSRESTGFGAEVPFPTTAGVLDRTPGFPRGFLSKFTPSGSTAAFSTLLPETDNAYCISVNKAGVDVLASEEDRDELFEKHTNRLLRVSLDGTTLINSSLVSTALGARCGQQGGIFALAADTSVPLLNHPVTSADLNAIGPGGGDDVWFSVIGADAPGAPRFEVDTGELQLRGRPEPDGAMKQVTRTIHAKTSGGAVPLSVSGYETVSVSPSRATTPADVVVTAPQGGYRDQLIFFAPGAKDALAIVPVLMGSSSVFFDVQPLDSGFLRLFATGAGAPPVSVMLNVSTSASADFFHSIPTPMNFTAEVNASASRWLKLDPASGTTPAKLRVTVDPAVLTAGSQSTTIHLHGPHDLPNWPGGFGSFDIPVRFQVGSPAPAGPFVIAKPGNVAFRLTKEQPSGSATVRLESSGDPVSFTIDPTPAWLTVSPASGTTPADLKVTAAPTPLVTGSWNDSIQFRRSSDQAAAGYIRVSAVAVLPGYVGLLMTNPISEYGGYAFPPIPKFAPGSLFNIGLDQLQLAPALPLDARPEALASSLGGYSFTLNGIRVPLQQYVNRSFRAEIPAELEPGTYPLDEFDPSGVRIATAQITLDTLAPRYVDTLQSGLRARKPDGSVVWWSNPARPSETLLVRMTGQGAVQPVLANGSAATPGVPSTPVAPVTATIGGKAAKVLSAGMSASEAGILEVRLEVPDLADGEYSMAVRIGEEDAGPVPLKVVATAGPPAPQVDYGRVVNAAGQFAEVAPGSLFSIFGSGLAGSIQEGGAPLPTSLGGVSATIGGKQAPLLYVSPEQIDGQVPYEVTADPKAPVVVTVNGVSSSAVTVPIVPAAPGIFEFGKNRAVVQNQDDSLNDADNGAAPGSTATAYLTGSGNLDNPVATGAAAPATPPSMPLNKVTATVNGLPAEVSFSALAPGFIGLLQVSFRVPDLPSGTYPLVVTMNGTLSNSALITVK
jgi:uncharacterized protein (TIGR03437 family)